MKEKNFSTSPRDKNPIPGRPAHSNYYALLITPATKNSGQFHSEALQTAGNISVQGTGH
jgi:hypothetical protein